MRRGARAALGLLIAHCRDMSSGQPLGSHAPWQACVGVWPSSDTPLAGLPTGWGDAIAQERPGASTQLSFRRKEEGNPAQRDALHGNLHPWAWLNGWWRKAKPSSSSKACTGRKSHPREGSWDQLKELPQSLQPQPVPMQRALVQLPWVHLGPRPATLQGQLGRSRTEREAPQENPAERKQEGKVHIRSKVCVHYCRRNQPPLEEPVLGKSTNAAR